MQSMLPLPWPPGTRNRPVTRRAAVPKGPWNGLGKIRDSAGGTQQGSRRRVTFRVGTVRQITEATAGQTYTVRQAMPYPRPRFAAGAASKGQHPAGQERNSAPRPLARAPLCSHSARSCRRGCSLTADSSLAVPIRGLRRPQTAREAPLRVLRERVFGAPSRFGCATGTPLLFDDGARTIPHRFNEMRRPTHSFTADCHALLSDILRYNSDSGHE